MLRRWIMMLGVGGLLVLGACAPKAELIGGDVTDDLQQGIEQGDKTFDHSALTALLSEHVDPDTDKVDYAGLKADRADLDAYLETVAQADLTTLGEDEQMALLINAYNAYTLELIVENYPGLESIRDISEPWETEKYVVGGYTLSLNDIEHGLLRPLYKDPRIHFAVNCASIGCPPLRTDAFTGADLDAQLDAATRDTLSAREFVQIQGEALAVTRIMKWYGDDFTNPEYTGHADSLPAYIKPYTRAEVATFIDAKGGDLEVTFLEYDWSLNDRE